MKVVKRQTGFTLAETMVAVAILALIGVITFGTFARALQARDKAAEITDRYHQIRQGMLRMTREIAMAYLSAHKDCAEPRTNTLFVSKGTGGGARLDFTSFSHVKMRADANESDQNELSYFIANDKEKSQQRNLMRREQNRIDDEADEGGMEQVLIENVKDLSFEFYDPKQDRWEDDWDTTHEEHRRRLPMFVSIKLTAVDNLGKNEVFVTKTRIFVTQRLRFMGAAMPECTE